jgi:hypothetical protein
MKKLVGFALVLTGFFFGSQAFAHVSYRDLNLSSSIDRTVTSNIGWSDAADGDWGDSHHGAWYKFNLTQPSLVSITVTGQNAGTYNTINGSGAPASVASALNLTDVGFSLYSGLFPAGAYDSATALPVPSGKDGRWDALGDTSMANNSNVTGTVLFQTAVNSSTGNTETLLNYFLPAGDYTIGAGGAYGLGIPATGSIDENVGDHAGTYVIQAALSVQAVPVPAAVWLFGSALAGMGVFGRRKNVTA